MAVNCAALPDTLLESELFGHKAGAFTDAKRDKPGRFALADGGTIFLDEIGTLTYDLQGKLLLPGDELPDRYNKRKVILQERMHKWTLSDLCHLIRDLSDRSQMHALSPYDSSVLTQAQGHLLDEWVYALGIDRTSAMREMQLYLTPVAG